MDIPIFGEKERENMCRKNTKLNVIFHGYFFEFHGHLEKSLCGLIYSLFND